MSCFIHLLCSIIIALSLIFHYQSHILLFLPLPLITLATLPCCTRHGKLREKRKTKESRYHRTSKIHRECTRLFYVHLSRSWKLYGIYWRVATTATARLKRFPSLRRVHRTRAPIATVYVRISDSACIYSERRVCHMNNTCYGCVKWLYNGCPVFWLNVA